MAGLHPVVAIYSTFLNRAFDQLLMDVALHRQPVTVVLDRAGVTGTDGASHNGMWDMSILSVVPGPAARRAARRGDPARGAARGGRGHRRAHGRALPEGRARRWTSRRWSGAGRLDVLRRGRRGRTCCWSPSARWCRCAWPSRSAPPTTASSVTVVDPRWVLPVAASWSTSPPGTGSWSPSRTAAGPAESARRSPRRCRTAECDVPVRTRRPAAGVPRARQPRAGAGRRRAHRAGRRPPDRRVDRGAHRPRRGRRPRADRARGGRPRADAQQIGIAEIQVAPSPPGTPRTRTRTSRRRSRVIQASGLRYEVGALGTTLEGDDDAGVGDAAGRARGDARRRRHRAGMSHVKIASVNRRWTASTASSACSDRTACGPPAAACRTARR